MTQSAQESDSLPAPEFRDGRLGLLVLQGALLLGNALALIRLIDRLAAADWTQAMLVGQFSLALLMLSVSLYYTVARKREVYDPLRRLEKMLPEIRGGKISPDELSNIGGRLGPLAAQLREPFQDLRSLKTQLNEMDYEVRQRVAHRTEALERKIGSLRHQATCDALTGLLNRRAMDEYLDKAIKTGTRDSVPVSVLMIDVDNFKPLNDTLGHAAGDDLLRSTGQLLRSALRECDAAFRCGGDEFVMILQGSDLEEARKKADHLTSLVDGLVKPLKLPALPRLSVGVACMTELREPSAPALLEEADKRLYSVKKERKSRSTQTSIPKTPTRKSA